MVYASLTLKMAQIWYTLLWFWD